MFKTNRLLSILLAAVMCVLLACATFVPVFAEAEDTTAEETAEGDTAAEDTTAEETTAAETEAKTFQVSDVGNVFGIIVAVILGVGAVVAIVVLAPKNTAPKKK